MILYVVIVRFVWILYLEFFFYILWKCHLTWFLIKHSPLRTENNQRSQFSRNSISLLNWFHFLFLFLLFLAGFLLGDHETSCFLVDPANQLLIENENLVFSFIKWVLLYWVCCWEDCGLVELIRKILSWWEFESP